MQHRYGDIGGAGRSFFGSYGLFRASSNGLDSFYATAKTALPAGSLLPLENAGSTDEHSSISLLYAGSHGPLVTGLAPESWERLITLARGGLNQKQKGVTGNIDGDVAVNFLLTAILGENPEARLVQNIRGRLAVCDHQFRAWLCVMLGEGEISPASARKIINGMTNKEDDRYVAEPCASLVMPALEEMSVFTRERWLAVRSCSPLVQVLQKAMGYSQKIFFADEYLRLVIQQNPIAGYDYELASRTLICDRFRLADLAKDLHLLTHLGLISPKGAARLVAAIINEPDNHFLAEVINELQVLSQHHKGNVDQIFSILGQYFRKPCEIIAPCPNPEREPATTGLPRYSYGGFLPFFGVVRPFDQQQLTRGSVYPRGKIVNLRGDNITVARANKAYAQLVTAAENDWGRLHRWFNRLFNRYNVDYLSLTCLQEALTAAVPDEEKGNILNRLEALDRKTLNWLAYALVEGWSKPEEVCRLVTVLTPPEGQGATVVKPDSMTAYLSGLSLGRIFFLRRHRSNSAICTVLKGVAALECRARETVVVLNRPPIEAGRAPLEFLVCLNRVPIVQLHFVRDLLERDLINKQFANRLVLLLGKHDFRRDQNTTRPELFRALVMEWCRGDEAALAEIIKIRGDAEVNNNLFTSLDLARSVKAGGSLALAAIFSSSPEPADVEAAEQRWARLASDKVGFLNRLLLLPNLSLEHVRILAEDFLANQDLQAADMSPSVREHLVQILQPMETPLLQELRGLPLDGGLGEEMRSAVVTILAQRPEGGVTTGSRSEEVIVPPVVAANANSEAMPPAAAEVEEDIVAQLPPELAALVCSQAVARENRAGLQKVLQGEHGAAALVAVSNSFVTGRLRPDSELAVLVTRSSERSEPIWKLIGYAAAIEVTRRESQKAFRRWSLPNQIYHEAIAYVLGIPPDNEVLLNILKRPTPENGMLLRLICHFGLMGKNRAASLFRIFTGQPQEEDWAVWRKLLQTEGSIVSLGLLTSAAREPYSPFWVAIAKAAFAHVRELRGLGKDVAVPTEKGHCQELLNGILMSAEVSQSPGLLIERLNNMKRFQSDLFPVLLSLLLRGQVDRDTFAAVLAKSSKHDKSIDDIGFLQRIQMVLREPLVIEDRRSHRSIFENLFSVAGEAESGRRWQIPVTGNCFPNLVRWWLVAKGEENEENQRIAAWLESVGPSLPADFVFTMALAGQMFLGEIGKDALKAALLRPQEPASQVLFTDFYKSKIPADKLRERRTVVEQTLRLLKAHDSDQPRPITIALHQAFLAAAG